LRCIHSADLKLFLSEKTTVSRSREFGISEIGDLRISVAANRKSQDFTQF
jgi:hypothetical protein